MGIKFYFIFYSYLQSDNVSTLVLLSRREKQYRNVSENHLGVIDITNLSPVARVIQNDLVDGLEVISTLGMLSGMTREEKVGVGVDGSLYSEAIVQLWRIMHQYQFIPVYDTS